MKIIEFEGVIQASDGGRGGAFVSFPFDMEETFGVKSRVKVHCEFDGVPYRGSIVNMGAVPCIGILKSTREQIGKQPGDAVHVKLWEDDAPRVVEVPEDLAAALAQNPCAQQFFAQLSYSNKRQYVQWVTGAKLATTRATRITKAIDMLSQQKKSPR